MAPCFEHGALDAPFDIARRQVERGDVPFVILGIAGADGLVRLDAFSPPDGPRIGSDAVCLLASVTKPITASLVMKLASTGRFPLTVPRWLALPCRRANGWNRRARARPVFRSWP